VRNISQLVHLLRANLKEVGKPFLCRLFLQTQFGGGGIRLYLRLVNPHRLRNVLDLVLSYVLIPQGQLVLDLLVGTLRDADPSSLSLALQPGSDVHPISVNLLPFLDHIPKINPDAKIHPAILIG